MTDRMTISLRPELADAIRRAATASGWSASALCADLMTSALAAKGVTVKVPEPVDPWTSIKVEV